MGGSEIIFILFVVVMLFGADKVPEIARMLGKGMRQLKDATNEIKSEIQKSAEQNGIDTTIGKDITSDITGEINKMKEDLEDATGPIKRQM
ncbi:twin-arginine translocase TatA/TatE family subunit [Flavobacterium sp. '19STA2R22 D10 B1']|uniref:Sec-independent protein translocase subunit TatA/TatB n=1 Tax=Flavobacterium aerium TaxID=3037261 RepID=UPI00278BD2F1|nr:twin-arginine translocase TatA/TatE family subunit [Flavobacterium sp. '19STA2R22 D10 B1']